MTEQEKLEELADILDMEVSEIKRETPLSECESWDSIAVLSVIAIMNDRFNKFPKGSEFKNLKTIGELMDFIG